MTAHLVVREYARLTTREVAQPSLDHAQVEPSVLDWLCGLDAERDGGKALVSLVGRDTLKLSSYVGVLESPCGQVIEILPKHHDDGDDVGRARALLVKLIAASLKLKSSTDTEAGLELYQGPLSEWVMARFLDELDRLFKRGLRFDYLRVEEEQKYLRGQLDVARQLRQPAHKQHLFQIRHDVFLPDRPENRLLKSALDLVVRRCQRPDNWRLSHELAGLLHELPASRDARRDFALWRDDRLMAHYRAIRPWCELILNQHLPQAVHGGWRGISFLFPMERLFEDYVAGWLERRLRPGAQLRTQAREHYLCTHQERGMFQLRPDLLLKHDGRTWVLDTKWKRLDAARRSENYGLSQSDFYQLFAYGHHYLQGKGELVLIYPRWADFQFPLEPFQMQQGQLRLWVLPFDLERDELGRPPELADTGWPLQSQQ